MRDDQFGPDNTLIITWFSPAQYLSSTFVPSPVGRNGGGGALGVEPLLLRIER